MRLTPSESDDPLKLGGGKGIRTPDPLHAMQVLYQLSYTPGRFQTLAVAPNVQ